MKLTRKAPSQTPRVVKLKPRKAGPKGGRPAKEEAAKRMHRLSLYLTEAESTAFERDLKEQQLQVKISRNAFAVQRLFPSSSSQKKAPKSETEKAYGQLGEKLNQLIKFLNVLVIQLRAIGVNYNQSVKRLNSLYLPKEVRDEITSQAALIAEIRSLLLWSKNQYEQATFLEKASIPKS